MIRLYSILLRERYRRAKRYLRHNPLMAIGFGGTAVYLSACLLSGNFSVAALFEYSFVPFVAMFYLVAKIVNPTQGMTLDYQLVELKLIKLSAYKILLAVKLLGGSAILSFICLDSFTKMIGIISVLNAAVNVWIFLRNRWNSRIYDLLLSLLVIMCIQKQLLWLAILCAVLNVLTYIALQRVNYENILPLYKLMYKIGQQRYGGINYSDKESREIQVSAESLIGKAKTRNANWCERLYDADSRFMMRKELVRILANSDKVITNLIVSLLIGMGVFYIPSEYKMGLFLLLVFAAISFDLSMNRLEAALLLRGFIAEYVVRDIIKNKVPIYSLVNVLLMLPAGLFGWKWLVLAMICAVFVTPIVLYKCFNIKRIGC